MKKIGDWRFEVYALSDGSIETHWEASDYGTDQNDYGITKGTLWKGIADACHALGIIYPLVMDPDLATMSGLEEV